MVRIIQNFAEKLRAASTLRGCTGIEKAKLMYLHRRKCAIELCSLIDLCDTMECRGEDEVG